MKPKLNRSKADPAHSAVDIGQKKGNRAKAGPLNPGPGIPSPKEIPSNQWTFLTNHSHVLVLLSRNPSMVLRQVAVEVGITERAVQRIIGDLETGGIIEREKIGRQNHYRIQYSQSLRHPIEAHRTIGDLLALVNENSD